MKIPCGPWKIYPAESQEVEIEHAWRDYRMFEASYATTPGSSVSSAFQRQKRRKLRILVSCITVCLLFLVLCLALILTICNANSTSQTSSSEILPANSSVVPVALYLKQMNTSKANLTSKSPLATLTTSQKQPSQTTSTSSASSTATTTSKPPIALRVRSSTIRSPTTSKLPVITTNSPPEELGNQTRLLEVLLSAIATSLRLHSNTDRTTAEAKKRLAFVEQFVSDLQPTPPKQTVSDYGEFYETGNTDHYSAGNSTTSYLVYFGGNSSSREEAPIGQPGKSAAIIQNRPNQSPESHAPRNASLSKSVIAGITSGSLTAVGIGGVAGAVGAASSSSGSASSPIASGSSSVSIGAPSHLPSDTRPIPSKTLVSAPETMAASFTPNGDTASISIASETIASEAAPAPAAAGGATSTNFLAALAGAIGAAIFGTAGGVASGVGISMSADSKNTKSNKLSHVLMTVSPNATWRTTRELLTRRPTMYSPTPESGTVNTTWSFDNFTGIPAKKPDPKKPNETAFGKTVAVISFNETNITSSNFISEVIKILISKVPGEILEMHEFSDDQIVTTSAPVTSLQPPRQKVACSDFVPLIAGLLLVPSSHRIDFGKSNLTDAEQCRRVIAMSCIDGFRIATSMENNGLAQKKVVGLAEWYHLRPMLSVDAVSRKSDIFLVKLPPEMCAEIVHSLA